MTMRIIKRVCMFVSLLCFSASPLWPMRSLAQSPERPAFKSGGPENLVMSAEQREAFRAARTVRVVSEVSAAKPENLLQPPKLTPGEKTFIQPFEEATAAVLEKVGVMMVKGDAGPADMMLHVQATVETRANSFAIGRSGDRIVALQYQGLGARWKGTVTATAPNVPPYKLSFEGDTVTPNPDKAITIMVANPEAAKLDFGVSAAHAATMALFAVGSYSAAIQDLVGQTHGRESLVAVLRDTQKANWWRGTAASTLGWIGGEGTADLLLGMLNDAAPEIRAGAADGLGRLGDRRAVEPLLKALHDNNPAVRARAARALGRLADPRAIEPLVETTLKDVIDEVSVRSAEALARLGDPLAVKGLVAALQDKNTETRRRAVRALGKLKGPQTLEPLAAAAKDQNATVREEAVQALGKLDDSRSTDILVEALRDSSPDVRSAAATLLSQSRDARAVEPLMAALADANAGVRSSVIKALGEIGDRRAGPRLLPLLQEKDASMRQAAAESLALVCDASCVEPLIAALKDNDARVRAAVAGALVKLTGQRFGEDRKQWENWWKQNRKTSAPAP
jgi:HEAT repeat protein